MSVKSPVSTIKNHIVPAFYGVKNINAFVSAIQNAVNQIKWGGIYIGDNLFAFERNLSFLHDEDFMRAFNRHVDNRPEQGAMWRTYVLSWAAKRSLRVPGDFVECACYRGTSARILCDYLDFNSTGKHYYLYDLFEHAETDSHHSLPDHSAGLYETVCARFADMETVHVTRGRVPEVLNEVAPEQIAFMHIDINDVDAEMGALKLLFDRLSPGGTLVLDDYGWLAYRKQKLAEDIFFETLGYQVLELPTGQGLLIK